MEVVPVSLATDGNYDDDLGHGYIRRPISVAQLMEREGYRPAARSRATRRALTGVAAGAVLALGAVVGSLLLNHATGNTAGDTLASGSSADIVVGGHGHQQVAVVSPQATNQAATQNGTRAISNIGQPQIAPNPGRVATGQPVRTVTTPATGSTQSQPGGAAQAPPVQAPAPVTPQSGTSTPTSPTSTTPTSTTPATGAPTASKPSTGATPAPASGGSSSSSGGLLGAVTGTLTGTLSSVTQPVFSWFGG
jgi:hypothetical protein